MGTLKLSNSSGNFIALDAPSSISADKTFTLPNADGSSGQVIQTNGSSVLSFVDQTDTFGLTHLTTVSTSSVSTVTVTGIPSTATVVYVNIDNFGDSTNNDSRLQMRVGNGSVDSGTDRYKWNATYVTTSNGTGSESSSGSTFWRIFNGSISGTAHRNMGTIQLLRTNDRGWIMTTLCGDESTDEYMMLSAGRYNQNTAIDRIHLFNASGDNFSDGGLVMVSYQ